MLPSDPEAPWDLLAKHLAGEATPGEREQLRAWVAADPQRLGLLTDTTRAWERVGAAPVPDLFSAADVDAAWQRFRPRMLGRQPGSRAPANPAVLPPKVIPLRPAPTVLPWLAVAATVLLLVGAVFFFRANWSAAAPVVIAATTQKRQLTLPDGSTVWLNRHSTLEYAADFNRAAREVQLTGEAFFEVRKDHGRPFTVLSESSRTRVLGTSFNVRAYAAEDSVEVSVVTGRVALASRGRQRDTLLLTPGQRGVLRGPGVTTGPAAFPTTLRRASTPDANFRAWQTDELAFDNAPLRHVVRTLRTTFGTSISVADADLLRCRFTGTFRHPADAAQVLRVVSLATNATLSGDAASGYILGGQGCE